VVNFPQSTDGQSRKLRCAAKYAWQEINDCNGNAPGVIAMVNKKNASHAIRQPERTGLAEF
jgi:hypothetical protein